MTKAVTRAGLICLATTALAACANLTRKPPVPVLATTPLGVEHRFTGLYHLTAGHSQFESCWVVLAIDAYVDFGERQPDIGQTFTPGGFVFETEFDGIQTGSMEEPGRFGPDGFFPCEIKVTRLIELHRLLPRPKDQPVPPNLTVPPAASRLP